MRDSHPNSLTISAIIPAVDEADSIGRALESLRQAEGVELLVVDGGSRDGTTERARKLGAKVLETGPNRACQMNAGAEAATGAALLFLHADTSLPPGYDRRVREILSRPGVAGGAFRVRFDFRSPWMRLVEITANWRSRYLQLPFGDQALFLRAALFRELGGFSDIPIMEDLDLVRRLKRRGRIVVAPESVRTSARRYRAAGPLRRTLRNKLAFLGFYLGASPRRIARWYGSAAGWNGQRTGIAADPSSQTSRLSGMPSFG